MAIPERKLLPELRSVRVTGNQKGIVLFSSLMLLGLLTAVGLGAMIAVQNNYRITANLQIANAAFYLAESGIEWSKAELGSKTVFPPDPVQGTHSLHGGAFHVSTIEVAQISAVAAKIVVRSRGNAGTSSQSIEAQLTKRYDLADAAIVARGGIGTPVFAGQSFLVSGADHDPVSGAALQTGPRRSAVTVSDKTAETRISEAVTETQRGNLVGRNAPAVGVSALIPDSAVMRMADDLCSAPAASLHPLPAGGILTIEGLTWGNREAPEIHCVEGSSGPGDSVSVTGSFTGAGILVVRDAELTLTGDFAWEGLVLISGNAVGLKAYGEAPKQIFGGVIIHETGPTVETNPPFLELAGAVRVLFSRPALANTARLVPQPTLAALYDSLPFDVTQEYWRALTP